MGSTIPERVPQRKAFDLLMPSARRGMEIMAPSGKFWMAMPRERECTGSSDLCISGQVACVHDADGHAFRDVVECDGQ